MNIIKQIPPFNFFTLFIIFFIGIEAFYLISSIESFFQKQQNIFLINITFNFAAICLILYAHHLIKENNFSGFYFLYFLSFLHVLWLMWQITDITAFSILNYTNISWLLFLKLIFINYFSILFFIFALFFVISYSKNKK